MVERDEQLQSMNQEYVELIQEFQSSEVLSIPKNKIDQLIRFVHAK
jgi:hypothetical protein